MKDVKEIRRQLWYSLDMAYVKMYLFVCAVCIPILLLIFWLFRRRTEPETIPLKPARILPLMSVGAVLCIYLPLYLRGVQLFDVSIYYPVINAGSSTLISVIGIFLFKDKLKPMQIAGLLLGTLSIILLTI